MPTLTAELRNDDELFPLEIELTETGGRVLASYLVDSEDIAEVARQAFAGTIVGAPRLGSPFDPAFPAVVCRSIKPVRIGGVDGPAGNWGTTSLQCTFVSPSVSGRQFPGSAGQKFATVEVTAIAITKSYALDEDDAPIVGGEIINNRAGVSAEVRLPAFKITRFYDMSEYEDYDFKRLIQLQLLGATNDEEVEIPSPPGFGAAPFATFDAGELRYIEWRMVDAAPGCFGIEHTVQAAPDHDSRWIPEDENGAASGPEIQAKVWPKASFADLW